MYDVICHNKIQDMSLQLLLGKIHGKLLILDCREETRERALKAVRILASHNALAVIDSLLGEEHVLPFDDAVVSHP